MVDDMISQSRWCAGIIAKLAIFITLAVSLDLLRRSKQFKARSSARGDYYYINGAITDGWPSGHRFVSSLAVVTEWPRVLHQLTT